VSWDDGVGDDGVGVDGAGVSDPLWDPDDPELLTPEAARLLAEQVEDAQLAAGAVRYGKVGRVGCARVVVHPTSPLPSGSFAVGLDGVRAPLGPTLLALEQTFVDAGKAEALVHASPTTVAEIQGLADEAGWFAVAERWTVVRVVPPDAPTPGVRPATGEDLVGIAELLADAVELPEDGTDALLTVLGHRLEDPRTVLLVVVDAELDRVVGTALGYCGAGAGRTGVGVVEHVVVRPSRRRRGIGTALLTAVGQDLFDAGASLVAGLVEEAGVEEALSEAGGFVAAYPVTTYARRLDELV
jgi:GNAT superfamily N-acetyltransferase